jgi:uncharacterized protein (TIGR03435 family)
MGRGPSVKLMSQFACSGQAVARTTGESGMIGIHYKHRRSLRGRITLLRLSCGCPSSRRGAVDFTALEEQLGLKLVPDKGSVDVLVIDHIELRYRTREPLSKVQFLQPSR